VAAEGAVIQRHQPAGTDRITQIVVTEIIQAARDPR
jgi:hypothetical protein